VSATSEKLTVVAVQDPGRRADGIRDYTIRLVEELAGEGTFVPRLAFRLARGGWASPDVAHSMGSMGVPRQVHDADAVLVQYNPFWYGRRGFAPGLAAFLWNLRCRRRRPIISLMVHETYVDPRNLRWALMSTWQRAQLRALLAAADVSFCSIERWTRELRGLRPRRHVHHLPVGSNLPDMRLHREESRTALGLDQDTTVIACFGLRHPERLEDHTMGAVRAVARSGRAVVLLNLGNGPSEVRSIGGVTLRSPGYLEAKPLASLLAASDVFLAPYLDGVSTRRTTVMAALQHGIPVVGTWGPLTDRLLSQATDALALVPVGQADRFAAAAMRLANDAATRRRLGQAGRNLYVSEFDWPVIAKRLVRGLEPSVALSPYTSGLGGRGWKFQAR
jgi:glycosyltransferase involved in cell wall biosynthesis